MTDSPTPLRPIGTRFEYVASPKTALRRTHNSDMEWVQVFEVIAHTAVHSSPHDQEGNLAEEVRLVDEFARPRTVAAASPDEPKPTYFIALQGSQISLYEALIGWFGSIDDAKRYAEEHTYHADYWLCQIVEMKDNLPRAVLEFNDNTGAWGEVDYPLAQLQPNGGAE